MNDTQTAAKILEKNSASSPDITTTIKLDYASTHRHIVERCKRGDRQAQFELYRLYSQAMYNICLRMVKNQADAEDLLQSSFIDVFTKLDTFRYQSSIGAWIKRIVINNCINFLKRKRVRFEELEPRHAETAAAEVEINDPRKDHFQVEEIKRAMMELPEGYRAVFSLYLLEGYDHKEIAQILDVTEATSKSQYSRAKKKLRSIMRSQKMTSKK
jgi:RNA polymerase sigma factor (sigma-70 family)